MHHGYFIATFKSLPEGLEPREAQDRKRKFQAVNPSSTPLGFANHRSPWGSLQLLVCIYEVEPRRALVLQPSAAAN
jgi:hypothetical protein